MIAPQTLPLVDAGTQDRVGHGTLESAREGGKSVLPLKSFAIRAVVADRIAGITVTETFHNPYSEPLEAVYIFPLAGGCAVSGFELKVGDRTILGLIAEREEARLDYEKALEAGKRAALMEQERDDVFTVQVGNLPPGEEVTVRLTCSQKLASLADGTTELRLPTVLAPRYIPGAPVDGPASGTGVELDTDDVPDASRITPPHLVDGFDPNVAFRLEVVLLDGAVEDLACSQHATRTAFGPEGITVGLSKDAELMDRDFVLRWRLAGDTFRTRFLTHRGDDGMIYGMLSITPPLAAGRALRPRDVLFVLDHSGSMGGAKMASAARACSILLDTLGPTDRFGVLAFDDSLTWFHAGEGKLVAADPANVESGRRFLRSIMARGGTEMEPALAAGLDLFRKAGADSSRARVLVFVTDGQVGNENQVLKRVGKSLGGSRIFTVGVDTTLNDSFLIKLARLGGGTCSCVNPGDDLEKALESIGREIGDPLVVDLAIEGSLASDSLAPSHVPDLFSRGATSVFIRVKEAESLRVRGRLNDGRQAEWDVVPEEVHLPALSHQWARSRITDLEDLFRMKEGMDSAALRNEIVETSIAHHVLSRFTAFLAVDESEVVNPDGSRRTVTQPVHQPADWEMNGVLASFACDLRSVPAAHAAAPFMRSFGRGIHIPADEVLAEPADRPVIVVDMVLGDLFRLLDRMKKELEKVALKLASRKVALSALRDLSRRIIKNLDKSGAAARFPSSAKFLSELEILIDALNQPVRDIEDCARRLADVTAQLECFRDEVKAVLGNGVPKRTRFWEKSV
jgi:Ca-activated chloride channel family protein